MKDLSGPLCFLMLDQNVRPGWPGGLLVSCCCILIPEARGDCAGFWLVTDVKKDLGVAGTVKDEVKEGGLALPGLADGGDRSGERRHRVGEPRRQRLERAIRQHLFRRGDAVRRWRGIPRSLPPPCGQPRAPDSSS